MLVTKQETKQQNGTDSTQDVYAVLWLVSFAFCKGRGWWWWGVGGYRGLGGQPNGQFTSLLLAVSSLPAPCLPTSSRGSFLSLSPSIRTRTTPDLSTISWMTLPFLPMTLPAQARKKLLKEYHDNNNKRVCVKWDVVINKMSSLSNVAHSPTRFLGT